MTTLQGIISISRRLDVSWKKIGAILHSFPVNSKSLDMNKIQRTSNVVFKMFRKSYERCVYIFFVYNRGTNQVK